MKLRTTLIFLSLLIASSFFGSYGEAQTLEEIIHLALKNSPMLKWQKMSTVEKKSSYQKESMFAKNPNFNFGFTNIPTGSWPALDKHAMSGISLGISQYIAFPWESHYRKKCTITCINRNMKNIGNQKTS